MTDVSPVSTTPLETVDLRTKIAQAEDIPTETVEVPEWGVVIEVRGMTGGDRAEVMQEQVDGDGTIDFKSMYPDVVIKTAYDPSTGARIFQDGDRAMILSKAGVAVDRIATVGLRLSGMGGDESTEKAGKDS